jgi:hypothetical protein
VVGEWREKYRAMGGAGRDEDKKIVHGRPIAYHFEKPVDCTGQLPDGRAFQDFAGLRDLLAANEEGLARAFLGHLIAYATGAPVSFADRPEVERILARAKASRFGVRTLILETALSPLFAKP